MVVLSRICIRELRNVTPETEIELHPGLNVLLGKNGTGKTTLLQFLADLLRVSRGDADAFHSVPERAQ